jgi:catechol 2,3-dioxygenase-like lactoylglutathione lyase family enzyme
MKHLALVLTLAALQLNALAQTPTPRPHILGIDHVSFYTTAPDGVEKLYGDVLGLASVPPLEPGSTLRYTVGAQWVGYSPAPDPKSTDRMDHVAFSTDDAVALHRYLLEKGINASPFYARPGISTMSFTVHDPEGHLIEFVQRLHAEPTPPASSAVSHHMIHAGFVVYHRDAEDHFYRDILGFRPYWHGGMKDTETDWVAMQVPDGTDWLEYMLNQPEHMSLQLTGVMNHISFGVADMKKAQSILEAHGWKTHGDEKAQMGKDGKWQLNLYDPDFVRVELMEFKPAQKPCCSDFTGPHPSE